MKGTHFTQASDDVLMHAIQEKDLDALEELYDRHHQTALAIAHRVLGDRHLAEDVVQEAFLAVWRQADSFRPSRGPARSWLLSIVRHRAIDVTRGRAFSREGLPLEEMSHEPRYPDVWQQVSGRLEKERVKQAVDTLPAEQREAILLAYFGGHTQQ